jgi:hypothetical protein
LRLSINSDSKRCGTAFNTQLKLSCLEVLAKAAISGIAQEAPAMRERLTPNSPPQTAPASSAEAVFHVSGDGQHPGEADLLFDNSPHGDDRPHDECGVFGIWAPGA